jgi:hypothetical protein
VINDDRNSRVWKDVIEGGCELLGVIVDIAEIVLTAAGEILTGLF